MATALAGPDGSLTELESRVVGQRTRVLVVNLPSKAGRPANVLYSELSHAPAKMSVNYTDLFADSSGTWVFLWPTTDIARLPIPGLIGAGWLSGGRLHPLPGLGQISPQGVAW